MEGDELETGASTFISTSLVSSSEESSEDESSLEDSCRDAKRRRWIERGEEERRVSSPQKFQPTSTRELLHRPSMNEKLNSQQRQP